MTDVNPYLIHPPIGDLPQKNQSLSWFGKKKSVVLGFLGMVALTISAGLGVALVQRQQIFSQKAATDTTAAKIAEIAKEIGRSSETNIFTYTSPKYGYQLGFDKNYWAPVNSDLSKPNLDKINLSLNGQAGNAQVSLSVHDLSSKIFGQSVNTDKLDQLATLIAKETGAVSRERVTKNGVDFEKLTYDFTFLKQKSQYYSLITIKENSYFVITLKYSKFGSGQALSENLINSFSFIPFSPSVKSASTNNPPVTALDESKIVELTKPAVFEIAHLFCNQINFPDLSGTKYLKQNYTFCDGSLGSGFAINQDGFVATNGHVAKNYPEEAMVNAFALGREGIKPFALDFLQEVARVQTGQEITREQAEVIFLQLQDDPNTFDIVMSLLYGMLNKNVMVLNEIQNKYFVKLANDPMLIDISKSGTEILNSVATSQTVKEAEFVASDYPNDYSLPAILNNKKETGSDVAIIKVSNPGDWKFPSVKIGTSKGLNEGATVLIIGYPGLVSGEGQTSSLIDRNSSSTPTVTKGIVSAIKNDQGGLKLIQVDASIDYGNSGGPAFDDQGNVIGIATYVAQSLSGNYNFLRDIEDLKSLASKNSISIEPSPTYTNWSEGLKYFWVQHYRQAELPFNQIQKDYPIHPSVQSYLSDSDEAIQNGQDKSDFLFVLRSDRKTQLLLGGGVVLFASIGAALIFLAAKKRNPKTLQPQQPTQLINPATYQTAVPHPNGPMTNPI